MAATDQGKLTIVLMQAYAPGETPDYTEHLEGGHFVVVAGYTKDHIIIMDPIHVGGLVHVPKKEFLDRWHFLEGVDEMQERVSLVFSNPGGIRYDPNQTEPLFPGRQVGHLSDFGPMPIVPQVGEAKAGFSGPAALQSLMRRYGYGNFQSNFARAFNWDSGSEGKVPPKALARFIQKKGIRADSGNLRSTQVEERIGNGQPVMLRIKMNGEVRWVIAFGKNEHHLLLMDPKDQYHFTQVSRGDFRSLATRKQGGEPEFESIWVHGDQPVHYDPNLVPYMP
jgi:ABC-type bacteriocin/lantibiotic exporter with double-glycine peptidase domain